MLARITSDQVPLREKQKLAGDIVETGKLEYVKTIVGSVKRHQPRYERISF